MKTKPRIFLSIFILLVLIFSALPTQPTAAASPAPYLVKDINPYTFLDDYFADNLTNVNGTLFFTANDGTNGWELWKSDGTAAGTVMVKNINPAGDSIPPNPNLTNVNGTLFFQADDGTNGKELWKSDGTAAGTVMVKDINPGGSSYPQAMLNINGTLFFNATNGVNASELWKSDGTPAGTVMVKDINPSGDSSPGYLANVNGTLFFSANDGSNGTELWKSDGTTAGTVLVKDIASFDSNPSDLTNMNGTLFFTAFDDTHSIELWKSDGSAAGTVMVKDINPAGNSFPGNLTNINGSLFFTADDGTNGTELWKSDGAEASTVMVKDIYPGDNSNPSGLTNINGTLFFSADDGAHGNELWRSDGTSGGTVMVKDINTAGDAYPDYLININGALFFSADDGSHGRELWRSDGTAAGTLMIADSNPGGDGFYDNNIVPVKVNGTLFFIGSDGVTGNELWAYAIPPVINYIVTFNANGGTGTMPAQTAGAATNLTSNTFTKVGYIFAGWNTIAGGGGTSYADNASYPFTANVTLYAQWAIDVVHTPIFSDVPFTHWANGYIERLYKFGVTSGCGNGNYCPELSATRAEMAIFILRAKYGKAYAPPPATGTVFADVKVGAFADAWIEQLAKEGITTGCGNGNYCPNAPITRAEMSVFLLRGKYGSAYTPPAATGIVFSDVSLTSFAAAWIEQLAKEGITSGCGNGNYCPGNSVTRAEMAVFLVKAFNLP